ALGGSSWKQVLGGGEPAVPNNTLPSGMALGRVTVAIGQGRLGDEATMYVNIGALPASPGFIGTYDTGTSIAGLYKSKDNGQNFTHVMLKENTNVQAPLSHTMTNINVAGHEAGDVGEMVVDPNNPAVVYLGGSDRFQQANDPPTHGLVRVDTRN